MNDEFKESPLGRALGTWSRSLRDVQPSPALEARIAASIREHTGVRPARPMWRRPLPWLAAVASVAVIAAGVALLLLRTAPESAPTDPLTLRHDAGDGIVIPSAQYSLWPTEGAVFRVKTQLGGSPQSLPGERQYWVDVRVANDGSMRIVRVLPANTEE